MSIDTAEEIVAKQMHNRGAKTRKGMRELYLAKMPEQRLIYDVDFSQYKFLTFLWLNGNGLREVSFLKHCCHNLEELYLHDNAIISIRGCMKHLHSLKILHLQRNKLENVEETVAELSHMHGLSVLNMSHNPLAEEKEYRLYTIAHLHHWIDTLDQLEVTVAERIEANKLYEGERQFILDRVAFGQKFIPKPRTVSSKEMRGKKTTATSKMAPSSSSGLTKAAAGADRGDASASRPDTLSHNKDRAGGLIKVEDTQFQYTVFDWAKIPRYRDLQAMRMEIDGDQVPKPGTLMVDVKPELWTVRLKY